MVVIQSRQGMQLQPPAVEQLLTLLLLLLEVGGCTIQSREGVPISSPDWDSYPVLIGGGVQYPTQLSSPDRGYPKPVPMVEGGMEITPIQSQLGRKYMLVYTLQTPSRRNLGPVEVLWDRDGGYPHPVLTGKATTTTCHGASTYSPAPSPGGWGVPPSSPNRGYPYQVLIGGLLSSPDWGGYSTPIQLSSPYRGYPKPVSMVGGGGITPFQSQLGRKYMLVYTLRTPSRRNLGPVEVLWDRDGGYPPPQTPGEGAGE